MKINHKDHVKEKLKNYSKDQIVITDHAWIRMVQRQMTSEEIIENIINPVRLEYAISENNKKYDCYFGYSKTQCHRYVLVLKEKVIVVTAIKINRRWQRIVDNKMRE